MQSADLIKTLGNIGANIRKWRIRRGLTQEVLAEISDLDMRFIQRVERGKTNMSVAVLVALGKALRINLTALFQSAKLVTPKLGRPPKKRPR